MGKLPSIQKFIAIAPFEINQIIYPKKRCLCLAEEARNAPETDNIIIMQLYIKYILHVSCFEVNYFKGACFNYFLVTFTQYNYANDSDNTTPFK